ncbi:diacylglycerol kinase family protein [Planococcus salinus]|uniref:Diacylglycerol kinase family protein n=1 Tax=Planococcus salinus TaxID=1848460 RepID=A0A3M8PDJ7_9BACL|nr:diacylglycerol kinase family protein [Planococcus salinus]RNF41020.1 diacylglycerol kinase family protein [Planococcus salinus]
MKASRFFRSFKFAAEGIVEAVKREQNMRMHLLAAAVVMIAGGATGLSYAEWLVVIVLIGGMISLELMNSAIERVVDLVTPEFHPLAKQAKDMAAGAVLVFAVASAIIGLLLFVPKWF